MKKKEYQKPGTEVALLHHQTQMLMSSPTSINAIGLDAGEVLILGDIDYIEGSEDDPLSGDVWEDAM